MDEPASEIPQQTTSPVIELKQPEPKVMKIFGKQIVLTKRNKIIFAAAGSVVLILLLVFSFTDLKYPVLDIFLNGSVEVSVVDSKTSAPLIEAEVKIDDKTAKTNIKGVAKLENLNLGKRNLKVQKVGYEQTETKVKLNPGANRLKQINLLGVGVQIKFEVIGKIGNLPLEEVVVEIGEAKSSSNSTGAVIVHILPTSEKNVSAKISKEGFTEITTNVNVEENTTPIQISLVPEGKHYFLSNRNRRIDVFESNLDGTEQKMIIQGTGKENSYNTAVHASQNGKWVSLLSNRENLKNASGSAVLAEYIFDTQSKTLKKIVSQISLVVMGWAEDLLIYSNDNGGNFDSRVTKLFSYDPSNNNESLIATANNINSIEVIGSQIFYSTYNYNYWGYELTNWTFNTVNANGSGGKNLLQTQVFNTFLKTKGKLIIEASSSSKPNDKDWFSYDLNQKKLEETSESPNLNNRNYLLSPDKSKLVYVATRDGKSDLYLADDDSETNLTNTGTVSHSIRWIGNDYVIYRQIKSGENADYIVNIKKGPPVKLSDVYSTYYYGY